MESLERSRMLEKFKSMLDNIDADFADIRYEVKKETTIGFSGSEIRRVGSNTTDGYVVRVLKNGGFSTATVTKEEDVPRAIELAIDGADTLVATGGKKTEIEDAPVVQETVELLLNGNPDDISMDEKIALTRHYNELMLNQPEIATTNMGYNEVGRKKFYVNTEGSSVAEEILTTSIYGEVIAKRNELVQNIRVSIGGADGYNNLLNRDEVFVDRAVLAGKLLDADPVKGGTYNVILSPLLTGVFTHEAFGHFSEADIIEDNPSLREKMSLGAKLGSDVVSIIADSTLSGQIGYYKYDDEGVKVKPVTLMENGVLKGRLHSRRSARAFNEPLTGHAVAEDMRYDPIIRMGTIFVKPGEKTFDQLISEMGDGLYLVDGKGGQTAGENFTFGAQYGFIVENGIIGQMIRDINIMGNLFTTLNNIVAVDRSFVLSERGGCGKGQLNIKSGLGGPHILIQNMVVGGV